MKSNTKVHIFAAFLAFWLWMEAAQSQTDTLWLLPTVQLDSVVISDVASGFDVEQFIRLMQEDTAFYQTFRNLRKIPFTGRTQIRMLDKKGYTEAAYHNQSRQQVQGVCRWMEVLQSGSRGEFFEKDGDMAYYTAELFSYIFLYNDTVCESKASTEGKGLSALEHRKQQLKVLMFEPGKEVEGIPFVQKELGIFGPDMSEKYHFRLDAEMWNQIPAYKFSIIRRETVSEKEVVLQQMETWFNRSDFTILARNYHLKENNIAFDFEVHMQVVTGLLQHYRVPVYVYYNGNWKAPGKRREHGSVQIQLMP